MKKKMLKNVDITDTIVKLRYEPYTKKVKDKTLSYATDGKLLIGATYAMTYDPGVDVGIDPFTVSINGKPVTSDMSQLFANPTPLKHPIVFVPTYKCVKRATCTIQFFRLTMKDADPVLPDIYLDVLGPHIKGVQFVDGPGTKEHSEYMTTEVYPLNARSDRYYITDDVTNINEIKIVM